MAYFRIFYATTAGIGCYCGSSINNWKKSFKVNAQILDPERMSGSANYQNPHLQSRFAKYGLPQRDVILRYKLFQTSFDQKNRMPNWVLERLNYDELRAPYDHEYSRRNESKYLEPRIKKEFQPDAIDNAEVRNVAGTLPDFKNCQHIARAIAEAYLRTNSVPMLKSFYTGVWHDLNVYCRYMLEFFQYVYVFSGPMFESMDRRRMLMRVSATNHVPYPSHYWKIIICTKTDENGVVSWVFSCFVLPHRRVGLEEPLNGFQVPLAELEQRVGFKLFKRGVNIPEVWDFPYLDDFRVNRLAYMPNERYVMDEQPGLFNVANEDIDVPPPAFDEQGVHNGHNGHGQPN